MKNNKQSDGGKRGSINRWKNEYGYTRMEMITELSKYYKKSDLENLMKWPSGFLKTLLEAIKSNGN